MMQTDTFLLVQSNFWSGRSCFPRLVAYCSYYLRGLLMPAGLDEPRQHQQTGYTIKCQACGARVAIHDPQGEGAGTMDIAMREVGLCEFPPIAICSKLKEQMVDQPLWVREV